MSPAVAIVMLLTLTLALIACAGPEPTATRHVPKPATAPTAIQPTTPYRPNATATPADTTKPTPARHAEANRKATAEPGKAPRPLPGTPDVSTPTEPQNADPLLAALSEPELQCLKLAEIPPDHLLNAESNPAQALACLSAPNVDLLMARLATLNHPALAPAAAGCLSQQKLGETAKAFPTPPEAQASSFLLMAAASYALATCLSQEHWTALGYSQQQRQLYNCIYSQGVTTEDLLEAVFSGDQEAINRVEDRVSDCEPPTIEPPAGTAPQHPRFPAAADVARRHTGSPEAATLISAQEYTWSNGAMGCPQPGQVYTEALVDGYVIHLGLGPQTVRVHSNRRGTIMFVPVNCISGPAP